MNTFEENCKKFFDDFGESKNMVLSTCADDAVSSRMMSVIVIDGCFYFQTDKNFRKCSQIFINPNVALCADNISVEGKCSEEGIPFDNKDFIRLFEQYYNCSYNKYSSLSNERLFKVEPVYIQKWIYEKSKPYIEGFDLKNKTYTKKLYDAC
ncbi:MAG: pyridoxamine 5'-phosphate oxidase family protein [Acutalibacteraceae bacterium]